MPRFIISILLLVGFFHLHVFARQDDSSSFCIVASIYVKPLRVDGWPSTGLFYGLQYGRTEGHLFSQLKFGFPSYSPDLKTQLDYSYRVKGYFLEPGIIYYANNSTKRKGVLFLGLSAYIGAYKHSLELVTSDSNWNTMQKYTYSGKDLMIGVFLEVGGYYTIYKNFKGNWSFNIGDVTGKENPLPQIAGFGRNKRIVPGIGVRADPILFGFNLGLHYVFK